MVRFTFASGKVHEYEYDWEKLAPKLTFSGIRLFKPTPNTIIPLNSHTIALVENIINEEEEAKETTEANEELVSEPITEQEEEKPEPEEKELSAQEKNDRAIALMKEMSECPHDEYDIYYQEIMSGSKTNPKKQLRYFPVCKKCGIRQRYVKAESLTEEQKENAKVWDK